MTNCIFHVDIDAFFASVEQRRDPRLRGKPVIVGSGVIASCSYEARRFGLRAGMPLERARAICPKAIILPGDARTYQCFAERIFEMCRLMSPNIETYLDEAYCDLTGTERLHGDPLEAGRRLRRMVTESCGLTVTIGIGTNRMVAKMAGASGKPDGLVMVPPGGEEEFIRALPVEKLPGVGHATHEVLRMLNIATIGDLQRLPREALKELFGVNGLLLYERCRGRDTRVVNEHETPKSISRETTFHRETIDPEEIHGMLHYLVERAARTLRELGLQCRKVRTHLRYSDYAGDAAGKTLPCWAGHDDTIYATARELLDRIYTRRVSLRHVGVTLSDFSAAGRHQLEIFEKPCDEKREQLYACLDGLRRRFGHSIIVDGDSLGLLGRLKRDSHGYVLRTPCLTK